MSNTQSTDAVAKGLLTGYIFEACFPCAAENRRNTMKKILILCVLSLAVLLAWAEGRDERTEKLLKEQRELSLKMHELRVRLIKEDPELKELHQRIMALHKELALRLDSRDEMKALLRKSKELDSELRKAAAVDQAAPAVPEQQ